MKFIEFVDGPSGRLVSRQAWSEVPAANRQVGDVPIARVVKWPMDEHRVVIEEYDAEGQMLRTNTLIQSGGG